MTGREVMSAQKEEAIDMVSTGAPVRTKYRTNLHRGLTGIYVIWSREVKRFWRDTPRRIGAFVQPIIYLALLGVGMQSAFKVFGAGSTKYVVFMFPGILGMTVLFTAVFSAISIVWDREFGFLKEVLVSPVPRSSVALGKIVGGATTALIQALIFMVLAFFPWFLGFSLSTFYKVLALVPVLVVLALGLTSLGVAIAARMRSFEGFPIVMNFILMPLFFLSGAFFPLQGLPGWMTFLTRIDPLTYGVDALRGIALRGIDITAGMTSQLSNLAPILQDPDIINIVRTRYSHIDFSGLSSMTQQTALQIQRFPIWLDVLVMLGFGIIMVLIAVWQFSRQE